MLQNVNFICGAESQKFRNFEEMSFWLPSTNINQRPSQPAISFFWKTVKGIFQQPFCNSRLVVGKRKGFFGNQLLFKFRANKYSN